MENKELLLHPTGQDNCRQPVILIVAEQKNNEALILYRQLRRNA